MKFRLRAFGLHLTGSACVLALMLGGFYFGWYRWPGWYLSGALSVVLVMCSVDLALGPTLTLLVANPHNLAAYSRADHRDHCGGAGCGPCLRDDHAVDGAAALLHRTPIKAWTWCRHRTWKPSGRPSAEGQSAFAPHWYSGVRWVWAPIPTDPEAAKSVGGTAFDDVVDMPRYFKPWTAGLSELREEPAAGKRCQGFSKGEKASLAQRLAASGIDPEQANAMVMWGQEGTLPLLTVFDPQSLQVRAMLRVHRQR